MQDLSDPAKIKAAKTYNAAADHFDDGALAFWSKYGSATINRLNLPAGSKVLDVAAGSGASAIPAARVVGKNGHVVAVDLAENLLHLAREKAAAFNLENIEFVVGDMTCLEYDDESFDAVICVFGIFFVPDMENLLKELWRMVKPGGKLAVTTWGPRLFAPMYDVWRQEVKAVRPDLYSAFNPWDRITTVDAVRQLFNDAGMNDVDVVAEDGWQALQTPEDWWSIVLGSGFRWTVNMLGEEASAHIRNQNLKWIEENHVEAVETNVIYAVATK